MFSIAARIKMISLGNVCKLTMARVMGMATSTEPTMPKRPPNKYVLFTKENFAAEKARNPKASLGDIVKLLSVQWAKLADADKKPYADKAARLREAYDAQITDEQRARHRRKEKDEGKPKMPHQSSFGLFLQEKFSELPAAERKGKLNMIVLSNQMAAEWRHLPDTLKSSYAARAAENNAKLSDMVDTWKQTKKRASHK